jgi:hypothetical protein
VQSFSPIPPEERRAAEERVVARYEAVLMRTMEIPSERHDTYKPIWPLADGRIRSTEAFQGIFIEEVRIERSYPDTVFVIVFRHSRRPECLFAVPWSVWHLGDLLEPEPHFNEVFVVNLGEWVALKFDPKRHECKPGETVFVRQGRPWSETLPLIAAGELDLGPENRTLAMRVLEKLELSRGA